MNADRRLLIQPLGFESPVAIAAAELARYLTQMAGEEATALPARGSLPPDSPARIVLGISRFLDAEKLGELPALSEHDDAYALLPKRGVLYLVGANPRSVLFAAYRLLEKLGCVFLRPGPGGEIVPRLETLTLPTRAIRETASYRHRGICIEGGPRLDHVMDLLDWMAKKKMNAFQLQFLHSGVFWRRGYTDPPEADADARAHRLTEADCYALDDRVIARVHELGMMLHRVGHGWTAAAVGLDGMGWEQVDQQPAPEKQDWLAEVKGKREVWRRIPANTELCYSKPEVRAAFVEGVLRYARQHSEVDFLHVWMSDSYNNKCECAACRAQSPSDWYVTLIDTIGQKLKAEGLCTRIVFLGYVDMLWPPDSTRLSTDNVTFMYAPITRCFQHALNDPKCDGGESIARPPLNEVRLPQTNRANADIMRLWRDWGVEDSFIYDYHNIWAVWLDGLGRDVAAVMAQDMKDLADLGLRGFMSCQAVRAFFPTPYLANAMADMLWSRGQSLKSHRRAVMEASFGPYAEAVEEYLAALARMVRVGLAYDHRYLIDTGVGTREELAAMASYAEKQASGFRGAAAAAESEVVRVSLEILALHAEQAARMARARIASLDRDAEAIRAMRTEYEAALPALLQRYGPWVDPLFGQAMRGVLDQAEKAAAE